MRHALRVAAERGHAAVLLVGDAAYYGRFGFSAEQTGRLWLPGLGDRSRLLGHELVAGALDGVRGSLRVPKKPRRSRLLDAVAALAGSSSAQSGVIRLESRGRRAHSARRVFRPSDLADMTTLLSGAEKSWPTTPSTAASTVPS